MIIGITGTMSSGKDSVGEYLEKKGFIHFALSDILRKLAEERKIPITRDSLRELADSLIAKEGDDYLVGQVLEYIKEDPDRDYVVTSIRRPVEIEKLKEFTSFFLIDIDADQKLRYERSIKRARENEAFYSFEEFLEKEKAEMTGEHSQNIDGCKSMADYIVMNNTSIKELYGKIDQILKEKGWKKKKKKT